ncbi:hypothetical protein ACFL55_00185 [Candidatus Latescibacterota bacterium]
MLNNGTLSVSRCYLSVSLFIIVLSMICIGSTGVSAQESGDASLQENALRVYLDGLESDQEYLTLEIPYVNFVRDRKLAQVHILMTTQLTGSGGTEHTLAFIGLDEFIAMNDTLVCASQQMDTEEMIRDGILNTITRGLIRYVNRTGMASHLTINYEPPEGQRIVSAEDVTDRWNYWVFNTTANGSTDRQSTRKSQSLSVSVNADRVTPDWKLSFGLRTNDNIQKLEVSEEDTGEEWFRANRWNRDLSALVVKSITPHWSAGFTSSIHRCSSSNCDYRYRIAPAIEYDVFPYAESTRRIFAILYQVEYTDIDYFEETVFSKTSEELLLERLTLWYQVREQWGTIEAILKGSHYLDDFDKNNLQLTVTLSLRLWEGLSLDISGSYTDANDQLDLVKRELTREEKTLNLLHRETDYQLNSSIGLRYTFGSIYSNVVNPRFNANARR